MSTKPSVFISYRRSDASEFAQRLHNALESRGIEAWLDVRDMPSGATFITQIDQAIRESHYFLLVGTPQAIESDYCRDEWKKAVEQYKPIIPLLRLGEYGDLPQEAHVYLNDAPDFRQDDQFDPQLDKLVKQVQTQPSPAGVARGLPRLPSHYLPRPALLKTLCDALTEHKTTVLTSPSHKVGVQGMGGVGKSVLSSALAQDYFVRRTFKDGVFWLTVGTEPRLFELWTRLAGYLGHANQSFKDDKEAQDFFEQATHDREILLILDDLWQSEHAEAFLHLGARCRLFVSSRDLTILRNIDAHPHEIGVLSDPEAEELLKRVANIEGNLPAPGAGILRACGNLPLALAMIGAMVQGKGDAYWQDTLDALEEADLEEISARFPEYPHPNLFAALKVSIDQLDETLRERYYDFVIFPDDVSIPEAVPVTFWKPDPARQVRKKLDTLVGRNLLNRAEDESLSLHDLFLTYLRRAVTDRQARQQRLLDQYRPNGEAWWEVCDPYLWKYLAYHLCEAGQRDTLHGLLFNFDFLQAKLRATDTNALLADTDYLADDRAIRLLQSALRLSEHVLGEDATQLAYQLTGRLWVHRTTDGIAPLWQVAHTRTPLELLCPPESAPPMVQAGGALLRTLAGHTGWVKGVHVLADGRFLSWCGGDGNADFTLRLWDNDGNPLATLAGHTGSVWGVQVLADGRFLSWSEDSMRLWDKDGTPLATLAGHNDQVNGVEVLADGRFLSWSRDATLRLWDNDGTPLATLAGHTGGVKGVHVLADGRFLSWSGDATLRLWDKDGTPLATLAGHTHQVRGVEVLADGRFLSGSVDKTLRLWDKDGTPLATLAGHTDSIRGVLVLADGRFLSWSEDKTLRLWDKDGTPLATLAGHTDSIRGVLVLADGRFLSWSEDKTLRLWDNDGTPLATLAGHTGSVWGVHVLADGRFLSWSEGKTLRLWDNDGTPLATLAGHTDSVWDVRVLADGRFLSWSHDKTLRLWGKDGTPLATLAGHTHWVDGVHVLADGRFLSWSVDKTLRLWDAHPQSVHAPSGHTGQVNGVHVLADGRFLSWSFDHTLRLWDKDGTPLATLAGHTGWVRDVQVLADGRFLSWCGGYKNTDFTLRLWDKDGTPLATLAGHTGDIWRVHVLADGRFLSWSHDKTLRLWDKDFTPLATLAGHTDRVMGVEVLADGRFLSWSHDKTLRLWDKDGTPLATLVGHTDSVWDVRVLADGRFLSLSGDKTLRLWGKDGTPLATLAGHTERVTGVHVLADGRFLSRSRDKTLRLWGKDGTPLATLAGHTGWVRGVQVLDNGRFLSWCEDKTLRLWDRQGKSVAVLEDWYRDEPRWRSWAQAHGVDARVLYQDERDRPNALLARRYNHYLWVHGVGHFVGDAGFTGLAIHEDRVVVGDSTGRVIFLRPRAITG